MDYEIRKIIVEDKSEILSMMKEFYSSDAVFTNGSEEIFIKDIQNCIDDNPYLEGFVFCKNGIIMGYSMIAKSFSTEFGKSCIWLEDLYLKPDYRGCGIIPEFIKYVRSLFPDAVLRLEAEDTNTHAVHVYKKLNFSRLPYIQMININKES